MSGEQPDPLVAEVFTALAAVLEPQPVEAWDAPSLCEGWRVRHVIAHVSNAARYEPEAYLAEVRQDGGDLGATGDRLALRDGERDPASLVADLRSPQLHRWLPPGGGAAGALTHAVVHGLDATIPLGLGPWVPDDARRRVLDVLTAGGVHAAFGVEVAGTRFEAADLDWSFGAGGTVERAPADELIARLTGRSLPGGA